MWNARLLVAAGVGVAIVAQVVIDREPRPRVPLPPLPAAETGPPPPRVPAQKRREPIANGPFYAATLDSAAQSYGITRYVDGRPSPVGERLRVRVDASRRCPGMTGPSVIRTATGYRLFAGEATCDNPDRPRVVVWDSPDGLRFQRRGIVRATPPMEFASVLRDGDSFRAWYRAGRDVYYAESSDGINFTTIGGPKIQNATPSHVMKHGNRWYLASSRNPAFRPDPTLYEFKDPAQPSYTNLGSVLTRRFARTRVAAPARAGQRTIRLRSTRGIEPGDLLLVTTRLLQADPVQVTRVRGRAVRLKTPLIVSHAPGDAADIASAGEVSPTYICRGSDGSWAGIFTSTRILPDVLFQAPLLYRARSIRGPWRIDRSARAPILSMENRERRRAVNGQTPVTRGPEARRCGA
jgi:hypothetical protein